MKIFNTLKVWFSNLFLIRFASLFYNSIDTLSQFSYEFIKDKNDLSLLIKPWYFLPVRQKKLFKIWSAIIEEYLKELKPELHEEHKKLQKRKAQALIDILQNFEYGTMGNMESRLKLEEILIDLDKFQNKIKKIGKEKDRTDSLLLEKYKTFLDKKNISVRQYHNYIAELYARN